MKAIRRFTVRPVLPDALAALDELAANLRWSWHQPTIDLFREVDETAWLASTDPVGLLGAVSPERLAALAADADFVGRAEALRGDLRAYLASRRQGDRPLSPRSLSQSLSSIRSFYGWLDRRLGVQIGRAHV